MTEHRFIEFVSRPFSAISVLIAFLLANIYFISILDRMIDAYAVDVEYREQDLSLATPAIDSMREARQQR